MSDEAFDIPGLMDSVNAYGENSFDNGAMMGTVQPDTPAPVEAPSNDGQNTDSMMFGSGGQNDPWVNDITAGVNYISGDSFLSLNFANAATGSDEGTSFIDSLFAKASSISGDTWAKIISGAIGGMARQSEADRNYQLNRDALNLKRQQDERSATSAEKLKWKMGMINYANKPMPQVTFTPPTARK